MPFSDVTAQISPAWHQWLRHTRQFPPSLTEQSQDLIRQERLKVLAAQADARWEAKARIGDTPKSRQALPAMRTSGDTVREARDGSRTEETETKAERTEMDATPPAPPSPAMIEEQLQEAGTTRVAGGQGHQFTSRTANQTETGRKGSEPKQYKDDPWKKARSGPSEEWQPKAWDPSAAAVKR